MLKYKNNKSRCTKKYRFTATEVARLADCSVSYVKKLRVGAVDKKSPLAQRVLAIDMLADDGGSALLKEIERLIKLP